jgi:Holliday junction resolvase
MNSRSKGNRNEHKAQIILEQQGWNVQRAGYRRFQQNDFWGLWDMVGIKPDKQVVIQVKTNQKPSGKALQSMFNFAEKYQQFICEIWVWYDRKGFKKWRITR